MLSDYSLDLNSETMISFLEMENVKEVETEAKVPNLADILTSCGIEYDLVDSPEHS